MAFSLGGSRWRMFRTVTLPLAVPGFANAFLLLFAASLADFATPLILAGNAFPVLPTQAYLQITGLFDFKGGAVLSVLLLVPAARCFLLQRSWVARGALRHGDRQGGSALRDPERRAVGTRRCFWPPLLAVAAVHPLFLCAAVSAPRWWWPSAPTTRFTWRHYQVIFTEGRKAIRDTLIIALIGMPLGGLYGVLVGYLVARGRGFPGARRWRWCR